MRHLVKINCCKFIHKNLFITSRIRQYSSRSDNIIPKISTCKNETLGRARERLASLGEGCITSSLNNDTGLATITIEHLHRRNAISGRMMVQFADIITELASWTNGRGVILRSQGEFFCSGGDLSTVKKIANPTDGYLMCSLMQDTLTRLHCLPLVSVSLVEGRALGGGAELMTSTDFRLSTSTAEVAFVQGVMGVATGWGGGTRLVQLLGYKTALDLLLTARKIYAHEALTLGLTDCILSNDEDKFEQAVMWLHQRIKFEPEIIHTMKNIATAARDQSMNDSLENEKKLFASLWGGSANMKALQGNIKH